MNKDNYYVLSQMSGEIIESFRYFEDARKFADKGSFIRFIHSDKTIHDYPRRYVVEENGICVHAKYNWVGEIE